MTKYVSLPQMAEILGVCNRTMWTYVSEGLVTGFRTPKGQWRFDPEKVLRIMQSKTNQPQTQIYGQK